MKGLSMRLVGATLALTLSGVAEPAALMAQQSAPAQQSSPDAQQPAPSPDRQEQEDKASQEMINRNHLPDNATPAQAPSTQQSATQTQQPPPVQPERPLLLPSSGKCALS